MVNLTPDKKNEMPVEPPQKAEPEQQPARLAKPGWWSMATHIIAYPLAAVAGYFPFLVSARGGVYKNYAKQGYFNDIQNSIKAKHAHIRTEALGDLDNAFKINISGRTSALHNEYREAVRGRFEKMGINSIPKYWQNLNPNQKFEAVFMGLAGAGVVLTTLLAVANNEWLLEQLNKKEQEAKKDEGVSRS